MEGGGRRRKANEMELWGFLRKGTDEYLQLFSGCRKRKVCLVLTSEGGKKRRRGEKAGQGKQKKGGRVCIQGSRDNSGGRETTHQVNFPRDKRRKREPRQFAYAGGKKGEGKVGYDNKAKEKRTK